MRTLLVVQVDYLARRKGVHVNIRDITNIFTYISISWSRNPRSYVSESTAHLLVAAGQSAISCPSYQSAISCLLRLNRRHLPPSHFRRNLIVVLFHFFFFLLFIILLTFLINLFKVFLPFSHTGHPPPIFFARSSILFLFCLTSYGFWLSATGTTFSSSQFWRLFCKYC